MPEGKTPEEAGEAKNDGRSDDQLQHQVAGMPERFDQEAGRDVRHDHHRNDPSEYETEKRRENNIGITRDVEEIEVAVNQALCAHDPEAGGGEAEHDRIVHGDPETERHQIKQD